MRCRAYVVVALEAKRGKEGRLPGGMLPQAGFSPQAQYAEE